MKKSLLLPLHLGLLGIALADHRPNAGVNCQNGGESSPSTCDDTSGTGEKSHGKSTVLNACLRYFHHVTEWTPGKSPAGCPPLWLL